MIVIVTLLMAFAATNLVAEYVQMRSLGPKLWAEHVGESNLQHGDLNEQSCGRR
jgi:hypothetical protein